MAQRVDRTWEMPDRRTFDGKEYQLKEFLWGGHARSELRRVGKRMKARSGANFRVVPYNNVLVRVGQGNRVEERRVRVWALYVR